MVSVDVAHVEAGQREPRQLPDRVQFRLRLTAGVQVDLDSLLVASLVQLSHPPLVLVWFLPARLIFAPVF